MTMELVKAELAGLGRRYRGQRYPAELRERIVALATAMRANGMGWSGISAKLGLHGETLRRWCGEKPAGQRMVSVHVVGDETVTVVSPTGWRIEGLSLTSAMSLLRAGQ